MKRFFYLFLTVVLYLTGSAVVISSAQEISFSYTTGTGNFEADRFRTDIFFNEHPDKSIRIRNQELVFADGHGMLSGYHQVSLSEDRSYVGALFLRNGYVTAEIYRSDGTLLHRINELAEYDSADSSVKIYMLNNGSFIYRDNIAGFSYYDELGEQVFQVYNSYGSPDGEAISEAVMTSFGRTLILYNPKIYHGNDINSRIQEVTPEGEIRTIASFANESIQSVKVHPAGRLWIVHTIDEESGNHLARVITYRGDVLTEIDYENTEVLELVLSSCARYVTARASGRVMVHFTNTGERMGSASFRERVLAASYMPDEILAVVTGRESENLKITELRAHMINIDQRKVIREESSLQTNGSVYFPLVLEYQEKGKYKLHGVTREIMIQHTL
ncbi:MAG: hypothetical protein WD272_07785 [Balneolales bacterium]